VISEIVPRDHLLDRAREIAGRIARLPPLNRQLYARGLTRSLRRVVDETSAMAWRLEGISAADVALSRSSLNKVIWLRSVAADPDAFQQLSDAELATLGQLGVRRAVADPPLRTVDGPSSEWPESGAFALVLQHWLRGRD